MYGILFDNVIVKKLYYAALNTVYAYYENNVWLLHVAGWWKQSRWTTWEKNLLNKTKPFMLLKHIATSGNIEFIYPVAFLICEILLFLTISFTLSFDFAFFSKCAKWDFFLKCLHKSDLFSKTSVLGFGFITFSSLN